jgi:hypothetical protein
MPESKPTIVCLCGSTRFYEEFVYANYTETMAGRIVLSVGVFGHRPLVHRVPRPDESKDPKFIQPDGHVISLSTEDKVALDQLHKRKIDLADEVLVINPGRYIGDSTRSEIAYASALGKPIRYMEEPE